MVIFYKKWKKYNETQLTKNKIDLNIRKMTNHPPRKKASSIQDGYRKYVTHARVSSPTLAHANSKKEDKRAEEEGKQRRENMAKNKAYHEIKKCGLYLPLLKMCLQPSGIEPGTSEPQVTALAMRPLRAFG